MFGKIWGIIAGVFKDIMQEIICTIFPLTITSTLPRFLKEFIWVTLPFIVLWTLPPVIRLIRRKRAKEISKKLDTHNFTIQSSKLSCIFSLLLLFIYLAQVIYLNCQMINLNIFKKIGIILNIFFLLLLFLLILGCISDFRRKIVVKDNSVEYTPIIGKKKKYNFADIKKVKIKYYAMDFIIFTVITDRIIFRFTNLEAGYNLLLDLFEENNTEFIECL